MFSDSALGDKPLWPFATQARMPPCSAADRHVANTYKSDRRSAAASLPCAPWLIRPQARQTVWWSVFPKPLLSLLDAQNGDEKAASGANDFGLNRHLARIFSVRFSTAISAASL